VEVQCQDPDKTVARWGDITALESSDRVLQLDNATVTFVDGAIDSLVGVTLTATDSSRAGTSHTICGVRFALT